ncbi:uncharacterized protein LOC110378519 isoform X3 [Helicoverpa armigera]|uniref:uncharacterized protein LOC110378519 isoform X3 n=1 Tax=Helicoverpa armigera TaxID=29058 RepID=UPI000B37F08E|nr:uncharacterized protein LOC110378519 isoform X2 [Helicoverpa armigera]
MACEICEHCQNPVPKVERVTIPEGYSYHRKCHKCYVCSETNLQNAEVFKGVIFCSSCSQRIFQGCSTARKTKTTKRGRSRRTRHDRERSKGQDRRADSSRDGVIELSVLVGSATDSEEQKKTQEKTSKSPLPVEVLQSERVRQETCFYLQQPLCKIMKKSTEMGTTTNVTQELLRQINCPIPDCKAKHSPEILVPPRRRHNRRKEIKHIIEPVRNRPICSDLRVAELGVSTEIANMALRKKSEMPVIIKSNRLQEKTSPGISTLKHELGMRSDMTYLNDSSEYLDSNYGTMSDYNSRRVMDRRLGSILRIPLKYFKRNILTRSSRISILTSSDDERTNSIFRKIKRLLHEDIVEHQRRGVRKLYSTINRNQVPHRLGWVELVAKVSKLKDQDISYCKCPHRCKHYRRSHNYRCMRDHVMKLAGPTNSELACYRNKIKNFIAPQCIRTLICKIWSFLFIDDDYPKVKVSQGCGRSFKS